MSTRPAPVHESNSLSGAPAETSVYTSATRTDWEQAGDGGFWLKRLYENEEKGERTWLMRVDPGAFSPPHAHEDFEQVYVLEGTFFDDDRLLAAGDYCCRAPGAMHSAGSDEGALVLVMYTPA